MEDVQKYYDKIVEDEFQRLNRHRTEYYVTLRCFEEYMPNPPQKILDVGGGPGRYSIELAKKGYNVTLIDLSLENINLAKKVSKEKGVLLNDYIHGNAINLTNHINETFDIILLMGPLYHLPKLNERKKVLNESLKLLKPNGLIFASFITRYAMIRDLARKNPKWIANNYSYVKSIIDSGIHVNSDFFTSAYFAHPNEVIPFMEEENLTTLDLIGCEGLIGGIEEEVNKLEGKEFENWLDLNYYMRREQSLIGSSLHLLYVGQKIKHSVA